MKRCTKCGQNKGIADFYLSHGRPYNPCKRCVKESRRLEYENEPEKIKRRNKKSYLNNRDDRLLSMKAHRDTHKEQISTTKKLWWAKNRDRVLIKRRESWHKNRIENNAKCKQWRDSNKDYVKKYNLGYRIVNRSKMIEYSRIHYQENKEVYRLSAKKWIANNRERYEAYKKAYGKIYRAKNKLALALKQRRRTTLINKAHGTHTKQQLEGLYVAQEGRCNICNSSLNGEYHKDHIIPVINVYSNDISNIQILCSSCNLRKGTMRNQDFISKLSGEILSRA